MRNGRFFEFSSWCPRRVRNSTRYGLQLASRQRVGLGPDTQFHAVRPRM